MQATDLLILDIRTREECEQALQQAATEHKAWKREYNRQYYLAHAAQFHQHNRQYYRTHARDLRENAARKRRSE